MFYFDKLFNKSLNFENFQVIFIPGDNDIGGNEEIVIREKIDRFHNYFRTPEIIKNGKIEFIMVIINKIIELFKLRDKALTTKYSVTLPQQAQANWLMQHNCL